MTVLAPLAVVLLGVDLSGGCTPDPGPGGSFAREGAPPDGGHTVGRWAGVKGNGLRPLTSSGCSPTNTGRIGWGARR